MGLLQTLYFAVYDLQVCVWNFPKFFAQKVYQNDDICLNIHVFTYRIRQWWFWSFEDFLEYDHLNWIDYNFRQNLKYKIEKIYIFPLNISTLKGIYMAYFFRQWAALKIHLFPTITPAHLCSNSLLLWPELYGPYELSLVKEQFKFRICQNFLFRSLSPGLEIE